MKAILQCITQLPSSIATRLAPKSPTTSKRDDTENETASNKRKWKFGRFWGKLKESHFRFLCWCIMIYAGFGTILAGAGAEKYGDGWDLALNMLA